MRSCLASGKIWRHVRLGKWEKIRKIDRSGVTLGSRRLTTGWGMRGGEVEYVSAKKGGELVIEGLAGTTPPSHSSHVWRRVFFGKYFLIPI